MDRFLKYTVSIKRPPSVSGGRRGTPQVHLEDIKCTPLDPISEEIALREALESPYELVQAFIKGNYDIREGDILVLSTGTEYPIRAVGDWDWTGDVNEKFKRLILEDVKSG